MEPQKQQQSTEI